jgi:hypothetical protein
MTDAKCLTKHCHDCHTHTWESICLLNSAGFCGVMEQVVLTLLQSYGVCYTSILDGDSRDLLKVTAAKPYCDSGGTEKLECVGHIPKRVDICWRKLWKDIKGKKRSDCKHITGRDRLNWHWSLFTSKVLWFHYKEEQGKHKTRKAVWATFYIKASPVNNLHHEICWTCNDSWCGYQTPKVSREDYSYRHSLPFAILEAIKYVEFEFLTAMTMMLTIFCDTMLCSPVKVNQCFVVTYCLHL